MLFGSVTFLFLFLPIALLVYYLVPARYKNVVLLAASLFFYAWGNLLYVPLLILSVLINYACGRAIGTGMKRAGNPLRILIAGILINLGLLVVFKYIGSFAAQAHASSGAGQAFAELAVPIGISFFTLQAISYLTDVYRGRVDPQKNFLLIALYLAMFPQMFSGPIVRYKEIEAQLKVRKLTWDQFGEGAFLFLIGLAKKTVLANGIAAVFATASEQVAAGQAVTGTAWIGVIAFMLQIYFNFSGYVDMAIGLGFLFGFRFRKNFRHPYTSKSITGFLHTWNISLGRWMRDYVWAPLGGDRVAAPRNIMNLLILSALTGLWYGGSLPILVWGLYCGILLILERYVWGKVLARLPVWIQHLYTLVLLLIGWVFFFSDSLTDAVTYLGTMFGAAGTGGDVGTMTYLLSSNWILLVVAGICCTALPARLLSLAGGGGKRRSVYVIVTVLLFVLAVSCLVTETNHPFLYFRF